ncbi:P-loop containing nucleoside triphosphate hydrolase protein [Emericellopsis atlantica]|uniref:ATP-dependent RNA helicase SUV3, mitochondrial n=1 Tax=Emericellopsis atlantica TaxID=2614577 RepID=A0A9P8CME8_9HYPO|nr:P-loop containing nucleoside triphosphate hydrolase protein [Emericellopsis atlantica]KAG9252644.1 P-loop containing nucleoside triphosphate hydrolase protein [Emericellopsis atlantica]
MLRRSLRSLSHAIPKNAQQCAIMSLLARTGAVRTPLCRISSLRTSQRCFYSTPTTQRNTKKDKVRPHDGTTTDARIEDVDRVGSVCKGPDPQSRLRQTLLTRHTGRHDQFRRAVLARFGNVLSDFEKANFESIGLTHDELNRQANLFMNALDEAFILAEKNITRRDKNPLFYNLREAFVRRDAKGITTEVRYAFQSFMVRHRFSKALEENQKRLLNFRFPQEWFPATRELQRTVHVHVGPTNSGKTYNAIQALKKAKSGVYAGPLRLLAAEVYTRFTAEGIPCALITGEELKIPKHTDNYFTSSTVEMIPLNGRFDVAVIDEIQMLGDPDRGNGWTMAFLGVQAKEVHVCGEERAVGLVQALCASVGDKCVIHRYERLSPLETMKDSLENDFSKLQKGDAVVAFSRKELHALKKAIEEKTGRRCAIIYGSLPPEVRIQQAALFNDPDNDYDFVVASDAIGMGLNLEIRRVILDSTFKYDGSQERPLTFPEIKQIGGRAGRYRTASRPGEDAAESRPSSGYVTTMEKVDLKSVSKAFSRPVNDLETAYIAPPPGIVERFASYYPPTTPLSFILMRIKSAAALGPRYQLCITSELLEIADLVQHLNLSIYDRMTLGYMPVKLNAAESRDTVVALARVIAENSKGDLLDIPEIPLEYLDFKIEDVLGGKAAHNHLNKLEILHIALNQYIWLSYRYTGMFRDTDAALHVRSLVEEKLIQLLDRLDFTEQSFISSRQQRRGRAAAREAHLQILAGEEELDENGNRPEATPTESDASMEQLQVETVDSVSPETDPSQNHDERVGGGLREWATK